MTPARSDLRSEAGAPIGRTATTAIRKGSFPACSPQANPILRGRHHPPGRRRHVVLVAQLILSNQRPPGATVEELLESLAEPRKERHVTHWRRHSMDERGGAQRGAGVPHSCESIDPGGAQHGDRSAERTRRSGVFGHTLHTHTHPDTHSTVYVGN
eukprot:5021929-Prymnesium_polylepis.1